jgi:hypothetical protein
MVQFSAKPGQIFDRKSVHDTYGGRIHSRISTVRDAPYIFLFVDPISEERLGLPCGMGPDGCFHVAGEGPSGDQKIKNGNLILSADREAGKDIHVFIQKSKDFCSYVGLFHTSAEMGWYRMDLPGSDDQRLRDGIVFRLVPAGDTALLPASSIIGHLGPLSERTSAYAFMHVSDLKNATVEKTIASSFIEWMQRSGESIKRLSLVPDGEFKATDEVFINEQASRLFLPCCSTSRSAVRAALGEAIDARRMSGVENATLLFASEPRVDVVELAKHANLDVAWIYESGWKFETSNCDFAEFEPSGSPLKHLKR